MKKIIVLLIFLLAFSTTGCGKKKEEEIVTTTTKTNIPPPSPVVKATTKETQPVEETKDQNELSDANPTLVDEDGRAHYNWVGEFESADNNGYVTLDLADSNSFEFTITATNGENLGELTAVARIKDDTASYVEGDFELKFTIKDKGVVIEEIGVNPYVGLNVSFTGQYNFVKE